MDSRSGPPGGVEPTGDIPFSSHSIVTHGHGWIRLVTGKCLKCIGKRWNFNGLERGPIECHRLDTGRLTC